MSTPAPAVALPRRENRNGTETVWNTHAPTADDCDSLEESCGRVNGVCCKDLKGEDERTLIDPDVVRDIVIGLSDGLTVPFALTAGLSSIGNSRIVVLGGFAELIAGAISMGIGGFLASQSELDHFRYLRKQTRDRVARSCDSEMMREVHAVLGPVGVDAPTSRAVTLQLRHVESEMAPPSQDESKSLSKWLRALGGKRKKEGENGVANGHAPEGNGHAENGAPALRWSEDVGLTAFLVRFGEGMEEVPVSRMYISAFTVGMGYFLGGLVPLLPYFFDEDVNQALIASCIFTGIILLIFGAVKTHFTGGTGGVRGYLWGAFSMLVVGGCAAAAAFGCVRALEVKED